KDIQALFNSRVDGMLLSISRETKNYDHIESIISKGVPVVFYDRMYANPETSKVIVDDYEGAKEAVVHLIEQGCKRIAHLEGAPRTSIGEERKRGYLDALKENNIPVKENMIIECPSATLEEAKKATKKLLSLSPIPDAIFANNDMLAMGAMSIVKEKGL